MEFNKINNLLGPAHDKVPRFITKKWIEGQSQSGNIYNTSKPIRFKTSMLRSDLCNYSDAYVWVKGKIIVTNPNDNANLNKELTLKNNAPFISCISKINNELEENAEDLDIVMPMYNLLEYSKNYEKTPGSLFNYYRDELSELIIGDGNNAINISIRNSKSFDYKTEITGSVDAGEDEKEDATFAIPLNYLGNFWRSLDIPLFNCEITLILSWYKECVLVGRALRGPPAAAANRIESPTGAKFEITDCKLYVPVVTLSAENDNKLLEQLKSGFKITIKWNKYMSQMSNQNKNNTLNYLIDPTFSNVNRLFVLSFENEDDRTSYSKYYMPSVEITDYNVLIDDNAIFELPIKNIEETYEKIIQITDHSGYYTRGNLLDYEYFKEHYKLIAIDLSKQIELENKDIKQQINFIGNLERDNGAVCSLSVRKVSKQSYNFYKIILLLYKNGTSKDDQFIRQ